MTGVPISGSVEDICFCFEYLNSNARVLIQQLPEYRQMSECKLIVCSWPDTNSLMLNVIQVNGISLSFKISRIFIE